MIIHSINVQLLQANLLTQYNAYPAYFFIFIFFSKNDKIQFQKRSHFLYYYLARCKRTETTKFDEFFGFAEKSASKCAQCLNIKQKRNEDFL